MRAFRPRNVVILREGERALLQATLTYYGDAYYGDAYYGYILTMATEQRVLTAPRDHSVLLYVSVLGAW